MTVDIRTRSDAPIEPVDPTEVFDGLIAGALDLRGNELAAAAEFLSLQPLVVQVVAERATEGGAEAGGHTGALSWTLSVDDEGRPSIGAGANAGPTLTIDRTELAELLADQVTPIGWMISGALDLTRGHLDSLLNWWLILRALLDGTTPYLPGSVELTDAAGAPLDLHRRFTLDDDPAEMTDFLTRAGFLHIGGVFTPEEMRRIADDMSAAAPGYSPGDGRSWWATLNDGSERLVRMQGFDQHSPTVASILADGRMASIGALTGDGHLLPGSGSNRIEALYKPIGVVRGISDVPWHKDCSIGRHSYDCCSLTIGISVTGGDATSGLLKVVAGSHRALVWPSPSLQPGLDLPVVELATETGDVTVHLSCTLHMAQPPTETERKVLYTSLIMEPLNPTQAALAKQRLGTRREAAAVTVSQPRSETAVPTSRDRR